MVYLIHIAKYIIKYRTKIIIYKNLQVPQEQVKLWQPEQLPIEQMLVSSELLEVNWSKDTWEKELEWSESFSKWLDRKKHASSSLMKSMQCKLNLNINIFVIKNWRKKNIKNYNKILAEVQELILVQVEIMKFKELC